MDSQIYTEESVHTFDSDDEDEEPPGDNPHDEKARTGNLQQLTHLLAVQMAPNKLKDAERGDSKEALEEAVNQYTAVRKEIEEMYADTGTNPDAIYERAMSKLETIKTLEEDLLQACGTEDRELIQEAMKRIRQCRVQKFLRAQLNEAQAVLDQLPVPEAALLPILAMDKKTMTELKHYAKPSPIVHRVMQATFLLLGIDEEKTMTWIRCQAMCNPDGPNGLNRKMMQFNSTHVKPFIARRVRAMLKDIELSRVQRASPGAATFYVWVQGILGEIDKQKSENDEPNSDEENGVTFTERELEGKSQQSMAKIIKHEQEIFRKTDKITKGSVPVNSNASQNSPRRPRRSMYQIYI